MLVNWLPFHHVRHYYGKFLNNQFSPKAAVTTVPKKRCVIVVPYLGPLSIFVNRKLKRLVHKFYPSTDLRIVYKRGNSIRNLFAYKDKLPIDSLSSVVYKIQCDVCGPSAAYIGKTINTIQERFYGANGHLNPSTKKSALLEHLMSDISPQCNFDIITIKVIDKCSGDLKLRFAESIHLKLSKQTLNTQERSIPLQIF